MRKFCLICGAVFLILAGSTAPAQAQVTQVSCGSLTGTGLVTFEDVATGNHDNIIESGSVCVAERFIGQTLTSVPGSFGEIFDVLDTVASSPLQLQIGDPNDNIYILSRLGSRTLTGLGPLGSPNPNAIGEGAVALLFDFGQSEIGFDVGGANVPCSFTINFFGSTGNLIDTKTVTCSNACFGFTRDGGMNDIFGVSIHNTDPAGIAYDNVIHDAPGVEGCEPFCPDPDPVSQGYWHRQCLGMSAFDPDCPGIDPGRGRGPQSPTEPGFCPDLYDCANDRLEGLMSSYGQTTCEGMDADPASDKCEKALKQLTALILNVCSDRLADACEVDVSAEGCSSTDVGDLIDEIDSLIQSGDCNTANACAAAVNEGTGLVVDTPDNGGGESGGSGGEGGDPLTEPSTSASTADGSGRTTLGPADEIDPGSGRIDRPRFNPTVPTGDALSAEPTLGTWRPASEKHDLGSVRRHLAVLDNRNASPIDRKVAEDALFDALGEDFALKTRLQIARGLAKSVDVLAYPTLRRHLEGILDEAQDTGARKVAKKAAKLVKQIDTALD
jgi:hypothetical protein